MNREQMVEKVGEALWDADTKANSFSEAYGWRPPGGDPLNDDYRHLARSVLDAILPQVTTVADLEALPTGSRLIDANGDGYRPSAPGYLVSDSGTLLRIELALTPLTVVWQPEVTA